MIKRKDGREANEMREIRIINDYLKDPEGSCLIEMGETHVICTATIQEKVPFFLKGKNQGWITAEYGMIPRSAKERIIRNRTSGRIYEIQRLIGRSFRSVTNLFEIRNYTIVIDCDVIQADGGTRTASITGGFVALWDAIQWMLQQGIIERNPLGGFLAAVSVGIVGGEVILDLNYEEDSRSDVNMNIVMTDDGKIVEIQGTGEKRPFSEKEFQKMFSFATMGIKKLIDIQRQALSLVLV
jgi:ribonuclease PH